jgi:uncharacterized protein YbjT (DUF2867 family)
MSLAITAPTGNIGSHLVRRLLDAGADLTLLVRHPDKLSEDVRDRVTIRQGALEDKAFVQRATQGAEALFWLAPPNLAVPSVKAYYDSLEDAAVHAVQTNRIPHVVFISSGGGGIRNAGQVSCLYHIEDALNATDANVLSLRCGYFMENFLAQLQPLRQEGAFYGLNRSSLPLPMVATRDIADVAALNLLDRSWQDDFTLAVHGPADVTSAEAAQILSDILGKPIRYIQIAPEAFRQVFVSMGASPDAADNFTQMFQAFDAGAYAAEPRTPETTTPTTLAEWATEVLKPLLA